ncbi:hypothetical protein FQN54_001659 [Arachnomyces sp. PD_36]|nr:hypothetical protein FQN54_001659 [Arachnomyces sp. PD_36]
MVALTVGYVSGIIAAGIYAVQFFIPTATTLILAGLLRESSTAATWSVVARAFQSSHWPILLNSDSQVNVGISQAANIESWVRPLALGVVSIAAIVTPLGLYDAVVPLDDPVDQVFQYAPDPSPMGFATPPRSDLGFNRICGYFQYSTCPGSDTIVNTTWEDGIMTAKYPNGYDSSIPKNLTDAFQSGLETMDQTVSSVFDIEYRSYQHIVDEVVNNGSKYIVGAFRQIETLALNDKLQPVGGLIVDTKDGGIGFRNHTVPDPLEYGATWSEDLLFIEPETQCVDTNTTLDFTLSEQLRVANLVITDHGGFVNLNHEYPEVERNDTQANPDLQARAYMAAWVNNAMTMFYLNVSNPAEPSPEPFTYMDSTLGKRFPLPVSALTPVHWDALLTTVEWGSFLNLPPSSSSLARSLDSLNQKRQKDSNASPDQKDTSKPTETSKQNSGGSPNDTSKPTKSSDPKQTSSPGGDSGDSEDIEYPNPFYVGASNFTFAQSACQGATGGDLANISNIGVTCGMVFGAARREDGSRSLIFDRGTNWTVPLYSCASAAKATIKTVDFRYNGTSGFDGLEVLAIRPKSYDNEEQKPLWGVERTEMRLDDGQPLWGLVSDKYEGRTDISVLRKDSLWLPGYTGRSGGESPVSVQQNLPGVSFYTDALTVAYNLRTVAIDAITFDYTGKSNLAMYAKWQDLSQKASTTSKILNLIWTDITANSVVGTRGWVQNRAPASLTKRDGNTDTASGKEARVSVNTLGLRVRYNLAFAAPGIIVAVVALIIAVATIALYFFGNARPDVMRKYLFHTSVGRVMSNYVYPGQCHPQAPTKEWMKLSGRNRIDVSGYTPQGMGPVMMANQSTTTMDAPLLHNGFPAPPNQFTPPPTMPPSMPPSMPPAMPQAMPPPGQLVPPHP